MTRMILALASALAIVIACAAHLAGDEPAAEIAGNVAYLLLFAALVVPRRKNVTGERGGAANGKPR
jgi:hypothetical protein